MIGRGCILSASLWAGNSKIMFQFAYSQTLILFVRSRLSSVVVTKRGLERKSLSTGMRSLLKRLYHSFMFVLPIHTSSRGLLHLHWIASELGFPSRILYKFVYWISWSQERKYPIGFYKFPISSFTVDAHTPRRLHWHSRKTTATGRW